MPGIVTIDMETHYDQHYSLSKMTTEQYVRDPRFEIIGVGVKMDDHPTDWYSGDDFGSFLRSMDYSDKAILCHNTAFDGAILSWHFGIKPKLWLDTLSMARPLHKIEVGGSLKALAEFYNLGAKGDEVVHAKGKRRADFTPEELDRYASYCVQDVDLTYALFKKLRPQLSARELVEIDLTLRMYTEPVIELDTTRLQQHLDAVKAKKAALLDKLGGEEKAKSILMSNPKFAALLDALGVTPPTKISPKTGKAAYAFAKTDKGMTDLLTHESAAVRAVAEARMGVKSTIEETRTEALMGVAERGRLPIMLNYYGAHTGRFSGGDKLNLQNLPSRGNNAIRQALCAPPGHKIMACDLSQIEARMLAWLAGQDDLVEAFRQGRDVYCEFASDVYGRTITKADKSERFVGKTAVLSLGYGAGAEKFREMLRIQGGVKIDENEAQRIVRLYRQKNHKIVGLWERCNNALSAMTSGLEGSLHETISYDHEGITLPNKLQIKYPLLRRQANGFEYVNDPRQFKKAVKSRLTGNGEEAAWIRLYGPKMVENLVQALAALVIREQMVAVAKTGVKVAFQVHDELVMVVPDNEVTQRKAQVVAIMSTPPAWAPDLPVECECAVADNYGDAK